MFDLAGIPDSLQDGAVSAETPMALGFPEDPSKNHVRVTSSFIDPAQANHATVKWILKIFGCTPKKELPGLISGEIGKRNRRNISKLFPNSSDKPNKGSLQAKRN